MFSKRFVYRKILIGNMMLVENVVLLLKSYFQIYE